MFGLPATTLIPAVMFSSECHHVIGIEAIRTGQATDDFCKPGEGPREV